MRITKLLQIGLPGFILAFALILTTATDARGGDIIQLTTLSDWESNRGEWFLAGSASVNPEAPKKLEFTPCQDPGCDLILANGKNGRTSNIHSAKSHGDVVIHVEFMVPKGSNSGVYLMGRYEIQILDSYGKKKVSHGDCGGIYQRWANNKGFEGHAPKMNASRPPGVWQTFDAVFRAPRFDDSGKKIADARFEKVIHNGTVVHKDVVCTGPTRSASFNDEKPMGPLMLQGDHGPVAYRNIWIMPLD